MIGCINDAINGWEAFYARLRKQVYSNRIPLNGSLELTGRCNFKCIHCYNAKEDFSPVELTTKEWKSVLDTISEAGTLFLLISGGEPLLRNDFAEIYEYAVKKGLIVTVFTNGSLVTDEIIDVFRKYPPRMVEITLYAASEEVYRGITGREGGLEICLHNVEKLLANKIEVRLKTVFLNSNIHEFKSIREIAERLKVKHRFDGALFPRLDGNTEPLKYRLSPRQVVELNCCSQELTKEWKEMALQSNRIETGDKLYTCGAAVNNYHIDAYGWLYP